MTGIIVMIAFSLYLTAYGFIALFKKEWLLKIRSFSARIEGKGDMKREDLDGGYTGARTIVAFISLALGVAGLVMSLYSLYLYFVAQGGVVSV